MSEAKATVLMTGGPRIPAYRVLSPHKPVTLTRIWLEDDGVGKALCADFSNAQHFHVAISQPDNADSITQALLRLAHMVGTDSRLRT